MELRNLECSEIEVGHFCDMFAQCANVFVLDARQRQVRRIRAIFFGDPQGSKGLVDPVRQFRQRRAGLDAREKSSGMMRIGKISKTRNGDIESRAGTERFRAPSSSSANLSSGHCPMNLLVM